MILLRAKRNDLFKILVDNSLIPSDFREASSADSYSLVQSGTPFEFTLKSYFDTEYRATCTPRISMETYKVQGPAFGSIAAVEWPKILHYFKDWASILKNEQDTPDMFLEFRQNASLFANSSQATPNENFTNAELRHLEGQLRQIEVSLSKLNLPVAAQKLLTSTIQDAPEKASRFTKKEWQSWFIGAVVSQVTNLALSPEHVTAIYQLLKSTFTGLLQLH